MKRKRRRKRPRRRREKEVGWLVTMATTQPPSPTAPRKAAIWEFPTGWKNLGRGCRASAQVAEWRSRYPSVPVACCSLPVFHSKSTGFLFFLLDNKDLSVCFTCPVWDWTSAGPISIESVFPCAVSWRVIVFCLFIELTFWSERGGLACAGHRFVSSPCVCLSAASCEWLVQQSSRRWRHRESTQIELMPASCHQTWTTLCKRIKPRHADNQSCQLYVMSSSNSGRLMATQSLRLIVILGICGALGVAALDDRLGDYSFHFHTLVFPPFSKAWLFFPFPPFSIPPCS